MDEFEHRFRERTAAQQARFDPTEALNVLRKEADSIVDRARHILAESTRDPAGNHRSAGIDADVGAVLGQRFRSHTHDADFDAGMAKFAEQARRDEGTLRPATLIEGWEQRLANTVDRISMLTTLLRNRNERLFGPAPVPAGGTGDGNKPTTAVQRMEAMLTYLDERIDALEIAVRAAEGLV